VTPGRRRDYFWKPGADERVFRTVPRFHFNLFNDMDILDKEGIELPDLGAAVDAASGMARDMAAQSVRTGRLTLHHRIEVANENGETVATICYGDVVEVRH